MLERKTTFHSAASATATGTVMNLTGANFVAVQITGTFTASVAFQGTIDASTWVTLESIDAATGAKATAVTAAGIYYIPVPGLRLFRANLTWTGGTSITATGICVDAAALPTSDITLAALAAGTALIGKVGIDQTTPGTTESVTVKSNAYTSSVSVTRPANTTAYTANDVIGTAEAAGGAVLTFANIGPAAGGKVMLTNFALEVQAAAVPSGMAAFRLWLFNASPTSNLGDNGAFTLAATDTDELLGYVDVSTPTDEGAGLYVAGAQSLIVTVPSGGSLYGYLQTRGAYSPSSATVKKVSLAAIGV